MAKALNEHLTEVEQKRSRIADLENSIAKDESRLNKLQEDYKTAVVNDAKNIDDLFHEIDSLERELKADKHKLETLKAVTDEHLRKDAANLLNKFHEIKPKYVNEAAKVKDKIAEEKKRHQEALNKLNAELRKINDSYHEEAGQYWNLIEDNKIKGEFEMKKAYPSVVLSKKPELKEKIQQEETEALKAGKIIPKQLYKEIERAANGESMITTEGAN